MNRNSTRVSVFALAALLAAMTPARAVPSNGPWSVTAYFGPATTKFFGAVFTSGRMQPNAAMLGLAADGRLLYLGQGISLAGEVEVTQYVFGHRNTTFSAGLGFQINAPFGLSHTRFSVYDGPSYALDPPYTSIGYHSIVYPAQRKKFENYVTLEIAVALSADSNWDVVGRLFHRSGAWGLYTASDDDGLAFGAGLKYRF
ncbi:MAG: hypothetical protein JSR60_14040 [Proteobacteria bacterium]|nr:hypothetical protein [Pseudomonadota bacterium]